MEAKNLRIEYFEKGAVHLSRKEKQKQGAIYTPRELAESMAKQLDLKERKPILDPCVGYGQLLAAVMNTYDFIEYEDLYGIDIDEEAIKFCIEKFPGGHFQVGDILVDDYTDDAFWEKNPFEKYVPADRPLGENNEEK